MTRWSAITPTRRSCSALAHGSRSTAAAEKTSTRSYTTTRDATQLVATYGKSLCLLSRFWGLSICHRLRALRICPRSGATTSGGRRKAKIPEGVCFQTTPELAGALCADAAGWEIPTPPILVDSAYGDHTAFRSNLHALELEYVVAVRAETSVYGPETAFAVPQRNGATGRPRNVARPDRKPESIRALAERLPSRAWNTLACRTTPAGERTPAVSRLSVSSPRILSATTISRRVRSG
jgi:DDE superfamily endonuclease